MEVKRRTFLKQVAGASSLAVFGKDEVAEASRLQVSPDQFGVLVDTTLCVGCRSCEKACNEINEDLPRKPAECLRISPSLKREDAWTTGPTP